MSVEQNLEKKLISKNVIEEVEKMVSEDHISYIEAIVEYCERNNVEIETASRIVKSNAVLKAKIQEEAEELNMVEKTAKLPI